MQTLKFKLNFKGLLFRHLRWIFLSLLIGLLAGFSAYIFLYCMEWATNTRETHLQIIWGLPLAGLFISMIYQYFGKQIAGGTNLIIDEIHNPKKIIPLFMGPFILISTGLTHLFGGSAGREGAIVQMGASLSDQLSHVFKLPDKDRKILLTAGVGASFGAALGAPWAGVIFGMEVINVKGLEIFALFECFIASFVASHFTKLLGFHDTALPTYEIPSIDFKTIFYILIAGMLFGLTAKLFVLMTHFIEKVLARIFTHPPLKTFFVGFLIVFLYTYEGSFRYCGLGIPSIIEALSKSVSFKLPALKMFFSSLTIGSGFKGGEFIPLVFIGSTLGSALATIMPLSLNILAPVGYAAVFAGASNTPLTCSILAIELFGFHLAPYAIIGCYTSYYFSGKHGIYKSQKSHPKKHH